MLERPANCLNLPDLLSNEFHFQNSWCWVELGELNSWATWPLSSWRSKVTLNFGRLLFYFIEDDINTILPEEGGIAMVAFFFFIFLYVDKILQKHQYYREISDIFSSIFNSLKLNVFFCRIHNFFVIFCFVWRRGAGRTGV